LKKMRAVSFVDRLELDFSGSVFKNAITLGDVDDDGMHELVVGNQNGDVYIFKGTGNKYWRKASDLGMVSALVIGDVFNKGTNSLVVVNGEGWCYIFDSMGENESEIMRPTHVQRIPANSKVLLLHDVNADGLVELVIGLTDRVVRTYQWTKNKLLGLNKWEFANQIGTVAINDMANKTPSLLVAHPGGTFIRLKCKPHENVEEQANEEHGELLSQMSIDYHPLNHPHMRNPNVSTEIVGNISQGAEVADESKGSVYAVATLDGTLMLVQDEHIQWSIQMDHQLFALFKLDMTGDGREEVVACAWDGSTYIINQEKESVRFQFDHSVSAFCAGHYSLKKDQPPLQALVYTTFHNKIYVYYDVALSRMALNTITDVIDKDPSSRLVKETAAALDISTSQLIARTLYAS